MIYIQCLGVDFLCSRPGFSFEAGGWTFRPVVSHSMSSTLIPIFEGFGLFFTVIIFFTYFLKRS